MINNRDRFHKTIFKTVCEFKKDNDLSEGPLKETTSFDDSLDMSTNGIGNERDVQTTVKKSFISSKIKHQIIIFRREPTLT